MALYSGGQWCRSLGLFLACGSCNGTLPAACKGTLGGQKVVLGLTFRAANAAECFVLTGATKLGTT